ncbi:MAG: NAD(P)/FAD-dependent oxidoreductase [Candidatus Marinimicrobia bacterium]|nr:NAD(P)/FAD-dependent oxidoreductase [Candidatus Neomarinimicrobiota bacterium]
MRYLRMWRQQKFDIIVVGGGPAGTTAARYAAQEGLSVLLLEKDRDIGVPVRCGEAVTDEGLRIFHEPQERWIKSTIKRLRLIPPSEKAIDLNLQQIGYILDRRVFDYDLGEYASQAGAQIVTKAYVTGLIIKNDFVSGVTGIFMGQPFNVESKLVIAADGVESRVGRWAGLKTNIKMKDMESAYQKTITGIEVDENRFDIYVSRKWAPGGYLWIFPKGPNIANVGLGVSGEYSKEKSAIRYLDEFLDSHFPNYSVVAQAAGGVPCARTLKTIVSNGLMLTGDAARMVNPMTGGGIVSGMRGGLLAAQTAVKAINNGDVSAKSLKPFQKEWHKVGGKNHDRFYRIKETIYKLSDDDIDSIADAVSEIPEGERTITKVFSKAVFKKPSLVVDVVRVFAGV